MHRTRRYRRNRSYRTLQTSMTDARSGEVVFVSHCLLNQNTRYLGGAVCPGVIASAIRPYMDDGTGMVQMPCPEQRVWGGVQKTRMLWLIEHPRAARAIPIVWPVVQRYIRARYAQQARAIAADVENYLASGLSVRGIVGVAGSPTCGVHSTMDLKLAARALACRRDPATAKWINTAVVGPALRPGNGQFIEELTRAMARRHAKVPILEAALPTHASSGAP